MKLLTFSVLNLSLLTLTTISMEQPQATTIIPAYSEVITAETPIKLTSLLYAFMTGKTQPHEDGSLYYDRYNNPNIVYSDTIKRVHETLEGDYIQ